MDQPKRKHRATGKKPPGGAREGAGRPRGEPNALELGEVQALKSLRWRVPDGTPEIIADHALEAWLRIVDVMRGTVKVGDPANTLRAAFRLRDEACGAPTQKAEVSGPGGSPITIEIVEYGKDDMDDAG